MSYEIQHNLRHIQFTNGEELSLPYITVGKNGYVHIPADLTTLRAAFHPRQTFGRGDNGRGIAKLAMVDLAQARLDKMGWPNVAYMPTTYSGELRSTYRNVNQELSVRWHHPLWGAVTLTATPGRPNVSRTIALEVHPFAVMWARRRIDKQQMFNTGLAYVKGKWETPDDDADDAELMNAFVNNPHQMLSEQVQAPTTFWQPISNAVRFPMNLIEMIEPASGWDSLRELSYLPQVQNFSKRVTITPRGEKEWLPDIQTISRGSAHLYDRRALQRVIAKTSDELMDMFRAFENFGMTFRIRQQWDPLNNQQIVSSLTINVPKKENVPGREHEHRFHVAAEGITVDCGYVKDEERYLEYKTRHAADTFKEMLKESTEWSSKQMRTGGE